MDKAIENRIGELFAEVQRKQYSRPPVLTNVETPEDENAIWNEIDALCAEHGVSDSEFEAIVEEHSIF